MVMKKTKRKVILKGLDKELNIAKVCCVNLEQTDNEFIYFEKMKSGDWRLAYTAKTVADIKCLESIEIVRE